MEENEQVHTSTPRKSDSDKTVWVSIITQDDDVTKEDVVKFRCGPPAEITHGIVAPVAMVLAEALQGGEGLPETPRGGRVQWNFWA